MSENGQDRIAAFFDDPEKVTRAMGRAVRTALRTHKLLGYPIVVWRDGKVVWVPPEEIEIPEETNGDAKP